MDKFFLIFILLLSSKATAESKLYIEGNLVHADSRISLDGIQTSQYSRRGLGYGMEVGIFVNERVSLGLSYLQTGYNDLDSRTRYSDDAIGIRGVYEYLHFNKLKLSVGGGLSWHQIDSEDFENDIYIKTNIEPAHTLNYDFGFGARYQVYDKIVVGFDYRFSSTILRGDATVKRETYLGSEEVGEIRNFGVESQTLLLALGIRG